MFLFKTVILYHYINNDYTRYNICSTWFLRIAFVRGCLYACLCVCVSVCVCVCVCVVCVRVCVHVPPRLLITSGMIWCDIDPI